MKIETSLDWMDVGGELTRQLNNVPFNYDLRKLITNIDKMVIELSKAEVEARRIHKPEYTKEKVDRINEAIDHVEKLITKKTKAIMPVHLYGHISPMKEINALAAKHKLGLVLFRKPGKLPCKTVQESYAKEYGIDTIEIHEDAINENDIILLHDDLLATGGTMLAACKLVKKFHFN